jgi:hypothetical protein
LQTLRNSNPRIATLSQEGITMTQHLCTCGYEAGGPEDLVVHFGEMFIPDDDVAPDGQLHAEKARDADDDRPAPVPLILTCRCGFTAGIDGFDRHLLAVFAPADRIGRDGKEHAPASPANPQSPEPIPGKAAE